MNKNQREASVQLIAIPISVVVFFILMWGEFSKPASDYEFVWPILWAIVASVIASILVTIGFAMIFPNRLENSIKDERDRRIHSLGKDYTMGFYVLGSVLALVFAMLELDYYWIALTVFMSASMANFAHSLVKLLMYRFGTFE
jgi:hypothetical protein